MIWKDLHFDVAELTSSFFSPSSNPKPQQNRGWSELPDSPIYEETPLGPWRLRVAPSKAGVRPVPSDTASLPRGFHGGLLIDG